MSEIDEPPKPPSVLLVANYPSDVGYAWWLMESFWASISSHLASSHQSFLAFPLVNSLSSTVASAPITVVELPFDLGRGSTLLSQMRFIRRNNVKLMYLTDQPLFSWRYAAYRLAGAKAVVVHDHTPGLRTRPKGLKRLLKRAIARTPWLSASFAFGVSRLVTERHLLVSQFPRSRCYTIRNGIPPFQRNATFDVHKEFAIPRDRRIVVALSRMHEIKGIRHHLAALHELVVNRCRSDVHYLHIGDGPMRTSLEEQTKALGIAPYVTFAGRRDDARDVVAGCNIGLHLSAAEVGYSLATLEAMAAGLPTIVNDDPSVNEATADGGTGFRVRAEEPRLVADRIELLLNDTTLARQLGENGMEAQRKHYSLDETHRALVAAIDEVLRQGIG